MDYINTKNNPIFFIKNKTTSNIRQVLNILTVTIVLLSSSDIQYTLTLITPITTAVRRSPPLVTCTPQPIIVGLIHTSCQNHRT